MKSMLTSKKIIKVGAFAMMMATNVCFAGGCIAPSCGHEIGTAIRYEKTDSGAEALRIMGPKDKVIIDMTRIKRQAISDGRLVAVFESHNVDDESQSEAIIIMKENPMKVGYAGFTNIKEFTGDFDTVSVIQAEYSNRGYEIGEFDGYGREPYPKARVLLGKEFS